MDLILSCHVKKCTGKCTSKWTHLFISKINDVTDVQMENK